MTSKRGRSEEYSQDMFEAPKSDGEGQPETSPLAARIRPVTLDEYVGQEHVIGPGRVIRKALEAGRLPSIILWGPPGSGKTTLANVIANTINSHFSAVSAVSAGVADLRKVIDEARRRRQTQGKRTILFIDEIHRFNKAQQDAILPFVEDGTVTLIGATTENPSFEVTSPLLSRSQVLMLQALTREQIDMIVRRALEDKEKGLGNLKVEIDEDAQDHLLNISRGDARIALNALEIAVMATPPNAEGIRVVKLATVEDAVQHPALRYDKGGDQHYDFISALHKSMRGSDPDASLYWLGRMVEAGEDPLYIIRRVIRFASEDIGMADPQAMVVAVAAQQAVHFVGLPEGNLALAEAVVYMATAPKSNSLYTAYSRVQEEIGKGYGEPVPLHLRNAVTGLMKGMGYGKDYKYPHDYANHFVSEQYLPEALQGKRFYFPGEQGNEKNIAARLKLWWSSRKASLDKTDTRGQSGK
jgi:putative ATPase